MNPGTETDSALLPLLHEETPQPVRVPTRAIVYAALAALGLLCVTTLFGQARTRPADKQYELYAPSLIQTLDALSTATSPEAVRTIAAAADDELSALNTTLDALRHAPGTQRVATLRNAFVYVSALQKYRPDDPSTWTDNRDDLMNHLRTLSRYGGPAGNAEVAGRGVERTLDELTGQMR